MALIRTDYGLIYNTDGSLCATLLPEGGAAVTEGTANLVLNPSFESESSWGTLNRVTGGKYGNYCAKVTYNWLQRQTIAISPLAVYTISADGKYGTGMQTRLNISAVDDLGNSLQEWNIYWSETHYTRKSLTITTPNDTVKIIIYLTKSGGDSDYDTNYGYIDGVQVEQKPFATPFCEGTRIDGALSYPDIQINLNTDFTLHFTVEIDHAYPQVAYMFDDDNHSLYFYKDVTGDRYILRARDTTSNYEDIVYIPSNMIGTFNFTVTRAGNKLTLYANGAAVGSMEREWGLLSSKLHIGTRSNGTLPGNGFAFKNTRLCPYTVSPETVAAWHSLDAPFFDPTIKYYKEGD